uniref:Cytochrome P450, family 3, subfamily C, polypeptide 4 n=1 Tax=Sinocyclocheilus rhinocerous TaxID=307959 RepID=A0A673KG48_9TELE
MLFNLSVQIYLYYIVGSYMKASVVFFCSFVTPLLLHKYDDVGILVLRAVVGPYSLDVVTSSSFSVDIDSINNADDPFVTSVKKFIQFNMFNPLFMLIRMLLKWGLLFFSKSSMDFFYSALKKIKDEHNKESDNLHIIDSFISNGTCCQICGFVNLIGHTDHEILSQSLVFILGGYETTSTTLTYLYNLATNPDCLEKLVEEIDTNFPPDVRTTASALGKAPLHSHHALMKMDYLEMAISESMRLLPTLWESPDEFRPERFSPECKSEMNQYAFLPFGLGPRNCIGMRFAQMIMKLLVLKLLQNFSMETCKETQVGTLTVIN